MFHNIPPPGDLTLFFTFAGNTHRLITYLQSYITIIQTFLINKLPQVISQ